MLQGSYQCPKPPDETGSKHKCFEASATMKLLQYLLWKSILLLTHSDIRSFTKRPTWRDTAFFVSVLHAIDSGSHIPLLDTLHLSPCPRRPAITYACSGLSSLSHCNTQSSPVRLCGVYKRLDPDLVRIAANSLRWSKIYYFRKHSTIW
jgi:hypothetical protein